MNFNIHEHSRDARVLDSSLTSQILDPSIRQISHRMELVSVTFASAIILFQLCLSKILEKSSRFEPIEAITSAIVL